MRRLAAALITLGLAACQIAAQAPRPVIPPGATVEEERAILCNEPPSSVWFEPCRDRAGR